MLRCIWCFGWILNNLISILKSWWYNLGLWKLDTQPHPSYPFMPNSLLQRLDWPSNVPQMAPDTMDFGLCKGLRAVQQTLNLLALILWTWLISLVLRMVFVDQIYIFVPEYDPKHAPDWQFRRAHIRQHLLDFLLKYAGYESLDRHWTVLFLFSGNDDAL